MIATEALESTGVDYILHTVNDGESAVEFLMHEPTREDTPRPHLIFLDLNLPRKDGREVLAEIKSAPRLSNIPVIILSTSGADDDIGNAYRLHANCYLVKPNSIARFTDLFRCVFNVFSNSLRFNHNHGCL